MTSTKSSDLKVQKSTCTNCTWSTVKSVMIAFNDCQVGHVTKSGDIAGPRVLEHIVDVVLYMEVLYFCTF